MLFNTNIVKILRGQVKRVLEPESKVAEELIWDGEKGILSLYPPNVWNIYIAGNMEREMEVEFEKFLINISRHIGQDIEQISTFKFYSMLEYLREEYRAKGKKK